MTLYILRHGESTANAKGIFASRRLDVPLSENGVMQARNAARLLGRFPISAVYASPLLRARQTAELACEQLGLKPVFREALAEVDVGELEGKSERDAESMSSYERVLGFWEKGLYGEGFSGGETMLDAAERLKKLLSEIESGGCGHVLLVGHCLVFMTLIWLFCDNRGSTLESAHMGRGHFSILQKANDEYRLAEFNIAPSVET